MTGTAMSLYKTHHEIYLTVYSKFPVVTMIMSVYLEILAHLTFGTTAPKSPDSREVTALKVSDVPGASMMGSDISSDSSSFTCCSASTGVWDTSVSNSSGETSETRLSPVTVNTRSIHQRNLREYEPDRSSFKGSSYS